MLRETLVLIALLLLSAGLLSQRGRLGDEVIETQDNWVNTYTHLTGNANAGDLEISVDDNKMNGTVFNENLDEGDLILIFQMQGVAVDISTYPVTGFGGDYTVQNSWFSNGTLDTTEFGQVMNYKNAGYFEYAEVVSISGENIINLSCGLSKSFVVSGHVQVIRVPRYENLTVSNNASISAPNWNGSSGGVVAAEINGELILTGTGSISADEVGFRGGVSDNQSAQASIADKDNGYLGSFDPDQGAEKGEGIFGFYTEYDNKYSRYCRGAIANGGGGANYHNAGGGGGSNVGSGNFYAWGVADPLYSAAWDLENLGILANSSSGGGRGGYSHAVNNNDPFVLGPNENGWSGDFRRSSGGVGGHALNYDPERIFMGGGGGAGDDNNNYGGDGGRGGGIVMLQVYESISGSGSITANGQNGGNTLGPSPTVGTKTGDDGAGGGGGGGSIFISNANPIPPVITLSAQGGNGGSQNLQLGAGASNQADGPGGAGAGGMIAFTSGTPIESVLGGIAGTTNSSFVVDFPQNGATGGAEGMRGLPAYFYDITVEEDTVCGGGSTTLTANVTGSIPSGSAIEWYNTQFGGTVLGSGSDFTTPSLTTTTTYYVGVCPGNFRVPVKVLVSPTITISGTPTIRPETCDGNDGSIEGLIAAGGEGTLSFEWNGVSTPSEDLTNAVGDSYELTVSDENGCKAISASYTINPSPGPSINLAGLDLQNETCAGSDGSITGIVASGSNITFEWNGNNYPDEDITGLDNGDYLLIVRDDANCTSSAGPFTVNTDSGPTIDDSNINIENETCFGSDGEITGIIATGTNISFEWNGNETLSQDTTGLEAGVYTLTVNDAAGCSNSSGPYNVGEVPGPTIDDSNIEISDEGCSQGNGSISGINASGDNLSFVWNGTVESSIDINNLSTGNYVLEVFDDLGCSEIVGPYNIDNIAGPTIDATNIVINDETCNDNDGSITGITSTGVGLSFEWNGNSSASIDLSDVSQGNYLLEVTDENGCNAFIGPYSIDSLPSPIINDDNLTVLQESCEGNDGAINGLQASGNGLSFEWNGQASPSINLSDVPSDNYSLVITDANNCNGIYGPVNVGGSIISTVDASPENSSIDLGQSVDLNADIYPNDASIVWNPGGDVSCGSCENTTAFPESSGWFFVSVTSVDGCSSIDSVYIEVIDPCGEVLIPSVFSPNGDNWNDNLCVLGGCIQTMNLQIFNRWGEKVFESNGENDCWDGTFNGQKVNTGTFIYKLNGTRDDGTEFSSAGNLSVIR